MSELRVAFFGDVVGTPGLRAFAHAAASLRAAQAADLIIVNAENARGGSGLSPDMYKELRRAGADALTLGDHVFKDARIADALDDPTKPVARPANLASGARGKTSTRLALPVPAVLAEHDAAQALHIVTVLGRLFMSIPADDPFAAVDREVARIRADEPNAIVLVEIHAEATSEKQAMAWHCLAKWGGTVIGVVGTHTHVQTADARLLRAKPPAAEPDLALAAMTDVGMCGGHAGVIGRRAPLVLELMTRQNPLALDVTDEEPRACGCLIRVDLSARRALAIEPLAVDTPP